MAFEESGVNLEGLQNVQPPSLNLSIDNFLTDMPSRANELTGGYFGMIVSWALFLYLFVLFSDNTQFGDFRYSNVRSIGIASGVVSILGMVALSVGFFTNIYHIVIFIIIMMICTIWVYMEER